MGGKERDKLDHKIICHVSPFLAHVLQYMQMYTYFSFKPEGVAGVFLKALNTLLSLKSRTYKLQRPA